MVTLRELGSAALLLVVATIITSVGADVIDEIRADQTSNDYDYNVSTAGLESLEELGDWFETIALIVAAVIVIGLIVTYFAKLR